MEEFFCENPACPAHVQVKADTYRMNVWAIQYFEKRELERKKYINADRSSFMLCSICSSAIKMVAARAAINKAREQGGER